MIQTVAKMYAIIAPVVTTKNSKGYKYPIIAKTKESSSMIGSKLKIVYLRMEAKEDDPLETILITFPVSLDK